MFSGCPSVCVCVRACRAEVFSYTDLPLISNFMNISKTTVMYLLLKIKTKMTVCYFSRFQHSTGFSVADIFNQAIES